MNSPQRLLKSPSSNYPACWKKPNEVIRQMKKRKRALDVRLTQEKSHIKASPKEKKSKHHRSERHNPFRKKLLSDFGNPHLELDESTDSTLFQLLNPKCSSENEILDKPEIVPKIPNFLIEPEKREFKFKENAIWLEVPPVDWSLKIKLRILSPTNFKWNSSTLKTTEEASGTTGFVRCLHSNNCRLDTSPSAELHQRCLIWMHPTLPWLKLFPRITTRTSAKKTFCSSDSAIQKDLYLDWCDSFRSLIQLLRSRQCAYFYLCAHSFTVLFRAAGIGGSDEINAMISPTTTGLRDALTEEGICFTQPLVEAKRHSPSTDSAFGTDSESSQEITRSSLMSDSTASQSTDITDTDEGMASEEDVSSWMSSVGLEEKSVLTGIHLQRKITQRQKRVSDSRPESLVYIQGIEVHALYNFLLNANNVCIASTGSLAGIPPTLISSVAFQGATLKPLKVKHETIQKGKNKFQSLELTGPILPHISHSLIQLLKRENLESQSYRIIMSPLETTTPFSKLPNSRSFAAAFSRENLADCGLHEDIVELLCSSTKSQVVNEIVSESGVFKCS